MEEKKRLTGIDIFNGIMEEVRKSGKFDEIDKILDYAEPCDFFDEAKRPISNIEFTINYHLDYGGSEGIYIDVFLNGFLDEKEKHKEVRIGTIKTLQDDFETMELMGRAIGILRYYSTEYLYRNLALLDKDPAKDGKIQNQDSPCSCPSCKAYNSITVQTKPRTEEWLKDKEQVAFHCNRCGLETDFYNTPGELHAAWSKHRWHLSENDTILVFKKALQQICQFADGEACKMNCRLCPVSNIKELRNIRYPQ